MLFLSATGCQWAAHLDVRGLWQEGGGLLYGLEGVGQGYQLLLQP
jgi:hypothetical protein